jgi:hypothetical protein
MKRTRIEVDPSVTVERILINSVTTDKTTMNNIKMAFYHLKKHELIDNVKKDKGESYNWTDLKKETDKLFENLTIKK